MCSPDQHMHSACCPDPFCVLPWLQMCEVLAKSMKEWERREQERHGFTFHPADCLAFKYLRDVSGWLGEHGLGSSGHDSVGRCVAAGFIVIKWEVYLPYTSTRLKRQCLAFALP